MQHHAVQYGEYMPHGMCLLWEPWLLLLWAGSDLLIFLSYTLIPIALLRVLRRRSEVPQPGLVLLFASFILLCGIAHFFMVVTLWIPIYPFVGWVKLATGIVSAATAFMLFKLVPDIIRLPSPGALELANRDLQAEISAHKATLASLDRLVQERTEELNRATTALAVQATEAVHRSNNLLAVVQALASQTATSAKTVSEFLATFLGRIRALASATGSIAKGDQHSAQLSAVIVASLAVHTTTYGERVHTSGPDLAISPGAAQQLSLALHELGTNTHKYGLGAAPEVRLDVTWTIEDDRLDLCWREYGGSESNPPKARGEGFGTKLLTTIIPVTLRGRAEQRFDSGELTYHLVVPLAAVTASNADSDPMLASRIINASYGV